MSNLDIIIQQERLFQEVKSGKLTLEYLVHDSKVKGVRVFGTKKLLYNRSKEDQQNNEQALRDLVKRIMEGIGRQGSEQLAFTVKNTDGKIRSVEWHSQQDKRFDNS